MSIDNIADAGREFRVGDSFNINLEAIWHYGFAQRERALDWRQAIMFMEGDWDMVIKPLRNPGTYEVLPDDVDGTAAATTTTTTTTTDFFPDRPAFAVSDGFRDYCVHGEKVTITEIDQDVFTVEPEGKPQFAFDMSAREIYWGTRSLD